jgi:hypothetical protein
LRPAAYKVASRWSDGATCELKTYALACPDCLPTLLEQAKKRRAACRLTAGEELEEPGIYELARGGRDKTLKRCPEFERVCEPVTSESPSSAG